MYLSLLVLGVIVSMAGAAMVAFGIPFNEFGLGNTLIIAGTTAIVGGLILIALADAVRQLRRIAENLMTRPGARTSRPTDLFEPAVSGGPGRIPFPPKPNTEGRNRAPAPVESRLAGAPSIDTAEDHVDRPPLFARSSAPEPRVLPERDEAPLSPQAEPRFSAARERDADDLSESLLATAFSRLDVSLRPAPPVDAPAQNEPFESLWPAAPRPGKTAEERVDEPKKNERPAEPYAISILKSGVVDGMAYTLYSDGSIEAEMPQGTMRFASITELRAYLDKSS